MEASGTGPFGRAAASPSSSCTVTPVHPGPGGGGASRESTPVHGGAGSPASGAGSTAPPRGQSPILTRRDMDISGSTPSPDAMM